MCPVTVLPSPPGPETDTSLPARRTHGDAGKLVDVVVGVDTHKHTHTAAVVSAWTGGVLDEATVAAEPETSRLSWPWHPATAGFGHGASRGAAATAQKP
jgi:hypothetical protein